MNKAILFNVLMNMVLGGVFVLLNNWALQNKLEETFIFLALAYGVVVVVGNAIYLKHVQESDF